MNNTLGNGLRLLEHLATNAEPHAVSDLARDLALPKSHVHRLLASWRAVGYVVQDPDRRYRIGLAPLRLSRALLANHPWRRAALPLLHAGAAASGDDWVLAVRDGDQVLTLAAVYASGRQQDPASGIGSVLALHASASGKCLLAHVPNAERRRLLASHPPIAITARTLTSLAALERDGRLVRQRGWACNDGENGEAIASLAMPLWTDEPTLAFLGLAGHRDSVLHRREELIAALREQRDTLAGQLHHQDPAA